MDRRSDKHGPRLDEALSHDAESIVDGAPVESRVEENREQEGLDDRPALGSPPQRRPLARWDCTAIGAIRRPPDGKHPDRVALTIGERADGRSADPVDARAELARRLEPSVFPAERDDLLAAAEHEHAPDWLLDALRGLPDATYPTTESVWRELPVP